MSWPPPPLVLASALATGSLCRRLGGGRDAAWGAALMLITIPAVLNFVGSKKGSAAEARLSGRLSKIDMAMDALAAGK